MQLSSTFALTIATALIGSANAFNINDKHVALFWGQNSALNQASLGDYCAQNDADIFLVSFFNQFGNGQDPSMNLANACGNTFPDSGLLNCPNIEKDIKLCQSQGKVVLMSLGGAYGDYGFKNDAEAEAFGDNLWSWFGEGGNANTTRPFGSAVVDGFDFDIEHGGETGYVALAKNLKSHFKSGTKQYYLSAAPQCPYPDSQLGDVFTQADLDFALIQFYNNYCDASGSDFNFDTWQTAVKSSAANKDMQLLVGLPGSSSAGSGYLAPSDFKSKLTSAAKSANFGGISLWDASQAYDNKDSTGKAYARAAKEFVDQYNPEPAVSSAPIVAVASQPSNATISTTSAPALVPLPTGNGPVMVTKEVTVTEGTKVYVTTTVCPLTEATGPAMVTKEVTVTEGSKVYVTTTVCPLTEATGPVMVTKEVTVTEGSKVYKTTTVCPLTEETAAPAPTGPVVPVPTEPSGPLMVTKTVTHTVGQKVYYNTTVCPLSEATPASSSVAYRHSHSSAVPEVSSVPAPQVNSTVPVESSPVMPVVPVSSAPVVSVVPVESAPVQQNSTIPAAPTLEQSNGAAKLSMAATAVVAMAGMLFL